MTQMQTIRRWALGVALLLLAGCEAQVKKPVAATIAHPLDPLSLDEYAQTVELLRAAGHLDEASRFISLELHDPAKATVLAWRPGEAVSRAAFAVIKQGPRTYEAVVDLTHRSVTSWTEIEGVQPSLLHGRDHRRGRDSGGGRSVRGGARRARVRHGRGAVRTHNARELRYSRARRVGVCSRVRASHSATSACSIGRSKDYGPW